jgi:hypothetical protein
MNGLQKVSQRAPLWEGAVDFAARSFAASERRNPSSQLSSRFRVSFHTASGSGEASASKFSRRL